MLQFLDSQLDYVKFSKCTFAVKKRPKREIVDTLGPGFCDTLDELNSIRKEFMKDRLLIDFQEKVISENYDVLWGISNSLIVNENIKMDVESNNLKGIQLSLIKSPQYIIDKKDLSYSDQ